MARQAMSVAKQLAERVSLPFRMENWKGQSGNWSGSGVGSSIDFQDHRQYLPGDDPRYINWQAYARTGDYTMKLYREEISPQVELVVDVTTSMCYESQKLQRTLELFYFCYASAQHCGARIRAWAIDAQQVTLLPTERIQAGAIPVTTEHVGLNTAPPFDKVDWKPRSLRIVISDLLFAGDPGKLTSHLSARQSKSLLFAPWLAQEAEPPWFGHVELVECESDQRLHCNFNKTDLDAYRNRYQSHFELWSLACRRQGITLARIDSQPSLENSLLRDALPQQAVVLNR